INTSEQNHAMQLLEGQGGAESLTFSPDGSMIAAGGDDASVMIFDAASGKPIERLTNHLYPISAIEWSSDGKWIASGDWSGVVRLWNTSTWSEYRTLTTTGQIQWLQFDAALTELIANHDDDNTIWDIATGADVTPTIDIGLA